MSNSKKLRLTSTHFLKLIVIIFALTSCGYAFSPVQKPPRDWPSPTIVEIDKPSGDIFAVSDPHGHYHRLVRVLRKAGLLDFKPSPSSPGISTYVWTGGNAVLVVVGDLIDNKYLIDNKPTGSLEIILLLRLLQTEAAGQGGQVIVTMGNHEAEFLADWNGDKTSEFRDELTAMATKMKIEVLKPDRVANCEGDLGKWLCRLPVAARVGEWFFAHAGYTKNRNIPTINSDIANDFKDNGFKAKQLVAKQSILEAGLDETGPSNLAWVFNGKRSTNPEDTLKQFTKTLGVAHIVQGHKPGKVDFKHGLERSRGELFQAYGLLFLIDSDMSTGPDDRNDDTPGAALRIHRRIDTAATSTTPQPYCYLITTQAIAIKKDGSQKTLWEGRVSQTADGQPCK
jgi:Calcineurin-like phosphoesterase